MRGPGGRQGRGPLSQSKVAEGNVFRGVGQPFCSQGWVLRGEHPGGGYSSLGQGVGKRPQLVTSSGGQQNVYGWQAGGTHPTGMLSNFCYSHAVFRAKMAK